MTITDVAIAGQGQQRRRAPRRLWGHILREFLLPLFSCLAAFSTLFLLFSILDDFEDMSKVQVPVRIMVTYFLAKIPQDMVNVIPVSVLMATSYMTVTLGKNNELTAMRASGLSLPMCAMPVWLVSILLCLVSLGIAEKWAPKCRDVCEEIQRVWVDGKKPQHKLELPVVYASPATARDWFFRSFRRQDTMRNVVVRQYDSTGRTCWVLDCQEADWQNGVWTFRQGSIATYDYGQDASHPVISRDDFAERRENWLETPEDIYEDTQVSGTLNVSSMLRTLRATGDASPKKANYLKVMIWNRLTFPLASLVGACFGFALSLVSGRSGVMQGFASAIGLLVLFYIIGELTAVLGKNGTLGPFLGGGASNILFTLGGFWLVWKRR